MNPFGEEQESGPNLKKNFDATEDALRHTIAEEEAHYRAKDQWDETGNRPTQVETTYPFWKGEDWTHEEKQSLRVAQTAIGLGTLFGVGSTLAGILRTIGAQEGAEAAADRSAAERATTGNVSAVNQGLEDSAVHSYWGQITDVTNLGLTAFGAIATGCYQYWMVWTKHKENVKDLNEPDVSKKRAGLEARLLRLQEKLRLELELLKQDEESHSHSSSIHLTRQKDKKKEVV